MTDETPVEGAAVEAKKAPRAKPQIEIEAERKAAEAAEARGLQTVRRAPPLIEGDKKKNTGSETKMVECRVLNKGEGRIQTGANPPAFYAAGARFEVSEQSAIALEARGYAERTRG